jgi:hypothetical protein
VKSSAASTQASRLGWPGAPAEGQGSGPVERNVVGERHACSKKPSPSGDGVITTQGYDTERNEPP